MLLRVVAPSTSSVSSIKTPEEKVETPDTNKVLLRVVPFSTYNVSLSVVIPTTFKVPYTSKANAGDEVPIPTFVSL